MDSTALWLQALIGAAVGAGLVQVLASHLASRRLESFKAGLARDLARSEASIKRFDDAAVLVWEKATTGLNAAATHGLMVGVERTLSEDPAVASEHKENARRQVMEAYQLATDAAAECLAEIGRTSIALPSSVETRLRAWAGDLMFTIVAQHSGPQTHTDPLGPARHELEAIKGLLRTKLTEPAP